MGCMISETQHPLQGVFRQHDGLLWCLAAVAGVGKIGQHDTSTPQPRALIDPDRPW
jgi:hypothetical protein